MTVATPEGTVISPGRVNLLGEHVDYNDGVVLPAAIDRSVKITFKKNESRLVSLKAVDLQDQCVIHLSHLEKKTSQEGKPLPDWALYPAGVMWSLQRHGLDLIGFDAQFSSNIPIGAGLSSSAAIEVGFGVVCMSLCGWQLGRLELAKLCQQAEREYVGVNCGLMDQFACACGVEDHVVMFDTRSLAFQPLPLPPATTLVIADSSLRRSLLTSAYNDRRRDCESVVAYFNQLDPSIRSLRDLGEERLLAHEHALPPAAFRHARHVVEEISRVNQAIDFLKEKDARGFGRLMFSSHDSLRDLFEVSRPELDILVDIAAGFDGCLGSRLTGAGFGGSTVSLVLDEKSDAFIHQLRDLYQKQTGLQAVVFSTRASRGAHLNPD